jgi:hypothetical protein
MAARVADPRVNWRNPIDRRGPKEEMAAAGAEKR